ncbi:MAG: class I SAM-dependent methyltransferase [Rubrivivax sp.]|nr:class I SAM-dependent methyltransferase [Rubrivivax sp.]
MTTEQRAERGLPIDELTHPLTYRLLQHALARSTEARRAGLARAYAPLPRQHFDEMEDDVGHTLMAVRRSLSLCLHDLDEFNALTPETENDAWYERPQAFSSMQLDALLLGFSRRRLSRLRDQLVSRAHPVTRVLEVGCGSGYLAALLADATQGWQMDLIDRSRAAIDFASAYHQARGTGHRVRCRIGDLAALPAADAAFDLVIAAEVLEHAPDPQASAAELLRVLRPGGWLAVSLPIDLDIAMHPTVFGSDAEILAFFESFGLRATDVAIVRPDPQLDAIAEVFPDFEGCVNALFQKPDTSKR